MVIPSEAKYLIDLQRSGYKDIIKDYDTDMQKEFNDIKEYLPNKCDNILDIGCGLCGMDVLLAMYYNNDVTLNLVDKDVIEDIIYYGYKEKTSFYNSFTIAEKILRSNKINKFRFINANCGSALVGLEKQDLIISLLSCGYHYPVETYIEKINELLTDDGVLIIDIRENTKGIETVKKYLPNIQIISTYNKSTRIQAKR